MFTVTPHTFYSLTRLLYHFKTQIRCAFDGINTCRYTCGFLNRCRSCQVVNGYISYLEIRKLLAIEQLRTICIWSLDDPYPPAPLRTRRKRFQELARWERRLRQRCVKGVFCEGDSVCYNCEDGKRERCLRILGELVEEMYFDFVGLYLKMYFGGEEVGSKWYREWEAKENPGEWWTFSWRSRIKFLIGEFKDTWGEDGKRLVVGEENYTVAGGNYPDALGVRCVRGALKSRQKVVLRKPSQVKDIWKAKTMRKELPYTRTIFKKETPIE